MSVVLAGGGTAGHIEPALALADALRRAHPAMRITCLGTERGLETRLVPMRGYDLALIPPVPIPRPPPPRADRGARREREAGPGQPAGRAVHPLRLHRPPGHEAAARLGDRHPD